MRDPAIHGERKLSWRTTAILSPEILEQISDKKLLNKFESLFSLLNKKKPGEITKKEKEKIHYKYK